MIYEERRRPCQNEKGVGEYMCVQPINFVINVTFLERLATKELEMSLLFEGVDGNRIFTPPRTALREEINTRLLDD